MNISNKPLVDLYNLYKSKIVQVLRENSIDNGFIRSGRKIPKKVIIELRDLRTNYINQKRFLSLTSFNASRKENDIPTVGNHSVVDLSSELPKDYNMLLISPV